MRLEQGTRADIRTAGLRNPWHVVFLLTLVAAFLLHAGLNNRHKDWPVENRLAHEECFTPADSPPPPFSTRQEGTAGDSQGANGGAAHQDPAGLPRPAVGLNKFDLFRQYLGTASGGNGSPAYRRVTQAMARKAIADARDVGAPYFRVSAPGYHPDVYGRFGDLDLWRSDPEAYWCLFDRMMNDLQANDIQVIPVFVWNWTQFPAVAGETAAEMITDPESESYQLLEQYVAEFVTRYWNHPALYFYELTNELNLWADLDNVERCIRENAASPARCRPMGNFTTDQMIAFTGRLAAHIRTLDSHHPISSGFSMPRPYAQHLRAQPEFSRQGPDWRFDSLAEFKSYLTDTHVGMDIVSVHLYNHPGNNERFGIEGRTNAGLLDIIKQATDELRKELFVGEFGDSEPSVEDDRNAPFTQNVLEKIVELEIPYSAPWVWEFYEVAPYSTYSNQNSIFNLEPGYTDLVISKIRQANELLGNVVPRSSATDITAPRVVLTWPLEGSRLACSQLVHAVASDDGGGVEKVVFLVEGTVQAQDTIPPYQFTLATTQFLPGTVEITARGYDAAGNTADYVTRAVTEPCVLQRLFRLIESLIRRFGGESHHMVPIDVRRNPLAIARRLLTPVAPDIGSSCTVGTG